jgi:hypothetical protein
MHHKRTLYIEKLQVFLTLGVLLAGVYYLLWPLFEPADPLGPTTLLATGNVLRFGAFAVLLWAMTALAAVTTTRCRAGSALAVALLGASGLAMRSSSLTPLLWQGDVSYAGLYVAMGGEMLLFVVVLLVAETLSMTLRSAARRFWGKALWQDPTAALTAEQRDYLASEKLSLEGAGQPLEMTYTGQLWPTLARKLGQPGEPSLATWRQAVYCCSTGVLTAVILIVILMASDARGQVLFAVCAACLLGSMLGQHLFPTRVSWAAMGIAIITALLFYGLAMVSVSRGQPPRAQFQVLPLDWMTFGCGGALLGMWLSERMRQTRIFDKLSETS